MVDKGYLTVNKIFAGIILAIFLYSALYSPDADAYPIKCIHEQLLGTRCPTCGMSHAFSALIRLQFGKANVLQPGALMIFPFFLIQLLMRISAIIWVKKTTIHVKTAITIDIVASLLLFLVTFSHLILSTFQIFYTLLATGSPD
jgi:hypothetical protein